jgi:small subunit ribosomal protein S16
MGRKKSPFYRIVVCDSRSPRDGKYIESLGYYNPKSKSNEVRIDEEKLKSWIKRGAQVTLVVKKLIKVNKKLKSAQVD